MGDRPFSHHWIDILRYHELNLNIAAEAIEDK
jgi:hypothetical protein